MPSLMSALRENVKSGGKVKFQHWLLFALKHYLDTKTTPPDFIPGPKDEKGQDTLDIHLRCVRCKKPNTSLLDIEIDTFSRLRLLQRKHKVCVSCREKASEHAWQSEKVVYRPRFGGPRSLGKLQKDVRVINRDKGFINAAYTHRTIDKKQEEE
jgi:hypothetical protein